MAKIIFGLSLATAGTFLPTNAAEASVLEQSDIVTTEFLPGFRSTAGTHIAAIKINLAPGWKTYWRTPGDGGIPTSLDFKDNGQSHGHKILWPHPQIFDENGAQSIGYTNTVVLPIQIDLYPDTEPTISMDVNFGVCSEICIPVSVSVSTQLPAHTHAPNPAIKQALSTQIPDTSSHKADLACRFYKDNDRLWLDVAFSAETAPEAEEILVVDTPTKKDIWVSRTELSRSQGQVMGRTFMMQSDGQAPDVSPEDIRLTLLGQNNALKIMGCVRSF